MSIFFKNWYGQLKKEPFFKSIIRQKGSNTKGVRDNLRLLAKAWYTKHCRLQKEVAPNSTLWLRIRFEESGNILKREISDDRIAHPYRNPYEWMRHTYRYYLCSSNNTVGPLSQIRPNNIHVQNKQRHRFRNTLKRFNTQFDIYRKPYRNRRGAPLDRRNYILHFYENTMGPLSQRRPNNSRFYPHIIVQLSRHNLYDVMDLKVGSSTLPQSWRWRSEHIDLVRQRWTSDKDMPRKQQRILSEAPSWENAK